MGADTSLLRSYNLGKPYLTSDQADSRKRITDEAGPTGGRTNSTDDTECTIYPATHRDNGSKISVFVYEKSKNTKTCLGSACVEALRIVRHPFILKYIGVTESERHIKLLTEDVVPLHHCVDQLELFEVITGLHNVLESLVFLHQKGGLTHGNLNWGSIFINKQDGSWKLGGMEKVAKYSLPGMQSDAFCFAKLATSLLECYECTSNEDRCFIKMLNHEFSAKEKIDADALKSLLEQPIFCNSYLETTKFLNSITMKSETEKKSFFSELADKLRGLNPETVARKFVPKLMSKMMLAEPNAEKFLLPHLLAFESANGSASTNIVPILPKDIYRKYCVPLLLKLFLSKQTHVRLVLLKYLPLFVTSIEKAVLESDVLPLVLLGLRDENDVIVTATFNGLATLVPILGGAVVVGAERSKFFVDKRPNFADVNSYPEVSCSIHRGGDLDMPANSEASLARKQMLDKKREERRKQMDLRRQERERKKKEKPEMLVQKQIEAVKHDDVAGPQLNSKNHSFEEDVDKEDVAKRHDESEPDWEGFEAFSSGTASDEDSNIEKLKPTISAENLLSISKGSLQLNDAVQKEKIQEATSEAEKMPIRKAMILGSKKKDTFRQETGYIRSDSLTSSASKDSDGFSQADLKAHRTNQALTKDRLPKKKTQKGNQEKLGEEFEFEISVKRDAEPDFFADMTPDLSKSNTILIEKKGPIVSSKFEAIDDTNETPSGWDDDEW